MTPRAFAAALAEGALPVDTRPLSAFAAGHVPGAVPIEFNLADLAERAALLLPAGAAAAVHAEPASRIEASVGLLADAGLRVLGHLEGGLEGWRAAGFPVAALELLDVAELHGGGHTVLDVREGYEFRYGHIAGARRLPSGEAWGTPAAALEALRPDGPLAVVCSGEGRAAFVAAVLLRHGIPARLVRGGMYAWERAGYPTVRGQDAAAAGPQA